MALLSDLVHLWELEEAAVPRRDSIGTLHLTNVTNEQGRVQGIGDTFALSTAGTFAGCWGSSTGSIPLDGLNAWGISQWVRFDDAPGSLGFTLCLNIGTNEYIYLRRETTGVIGGNANDSAATAYPISGTTVVPAGIWTHLALSYERARYLRLWVNAKEDAAPVALADLASLDPVSTQTLLGGNRSGANGIIGAIDQTAFFRAALTQKDVEQIYNGGAGGNLQSLLRPEHSLYSRRQLLLAKGATLANLAPPAALYSRRTAILGAAAQIANAPPVHAGYANRWVILAGAAPLGSASAARLRHSIWRT